MCLTTFSLEISQELLQTMLFFNFSHLTSYHKNQVHGLANLNSQTKFEFTLKFLRVKLLRKGMQEQQYFNSIVSIKLTFLAN